MLGTNGHCVWCTPGTESLANQTMCDECKQIYRLLLAADQDERYEPQASAWLREAAVRLRNPYTSKPVTLDVLDTLEDD